MPSGVAAEAIEESLRPLLDAIPVPTLVLDARWHILFANPAAVWLLGWSEAELQELPIDRLIPDQLRERYRVLRERTKHEQPKSGIVLHGERIVRTKDGRELPIDVTVSRTRIQAVDIHISSFLDVSSHKQQREAETALAATRESLRESEDRFRKAFRASPHPIGITEIATGRLVEVNDAFEEVFGYTREQVVGKSTVELGMWNDPVDRERMVALLRRDGAFRNLDIQGRNREGRVLWLALSGEQIDIDGRPHLVTYVHDLTERRSAERVSADLEQQLRQAQKMDALGTMAGGIAHDFNNILGAIMAYTELIKLDLTFPAQVDAHLDELRRAGTRARDLVRKILTFARRESRVRRPVRVDSAVRDARDLLRATLPADIQIDASIDAATPVVLADLTEIHQVVMNLGTNAAHAMHGRPGTLRIELDTVSVDEATANAVSMLRPRRYARIRVSDGGHGMSPETVSHIFEPFFTTKSRGEGSGLGLSVVHGIVREHEGAIQVESTPGVGTRFDVYLPEAGVDPDGGSDEIVPYTRGAGERVLLVDDEAIICRSVSQLLERLGYAVTVFTDPVAALHRFQSSPTAFDVVLTDLTMPTMTGVDLARYVLEIDSKMPVLVMSGFSGTWSAESLKAAGIVGLIPKPLSAAELTSALAAALKAGGG